MWYKEWKREEKNVATWEGKEERDKKKNGEKGSTWKKKELLGYRIRYTYSIRVREKRKFSRGKESAGMLKEGMEGVKRCT